MRSSTADDGKLFLIFLRPLNRLGIDYMVTGSVAGMAYGEPRATLDIDLVVDLRLQQKGLLASVFPIGEFYCPPEEVIAVEIKRSSRGHFNVIHMASGFKADFYPVGDDPLHRWAMDRRRRMEMLGESIPLAPPEYVIVRKLEYFREGGSEKHLRDIRGMLDVSGDLIDRAELETLIERRVLREAWRRVEKG